MPQLLLTSDLLLDLAHRIAEYMDPAIVLHAGNAIHLSPCEFVS